MERRGRLRSRLCLEARAIKKEKEVEMEKRTSERCDKDTECRKKEK